MHKTQRDFYLTKIAVYSVASMLAFYAVGFISGYIQASQKNSIREIGIILILVSLFALSTFGWKAVYWFLGLLGEFRVNSILETMKDRGFYRMWGVKIPGEKGDIDHIVVGKTGVWVVETKNSDGTFDYVNEILMCNGKPYRNNPLAYTYRKSKNIERYLAAKGINVVVRSALVFAGSFAKVRFGLHTKRGVYVIGYSWLPKLIEEGASSLGHEQVEKILEVLKMLEHRR